MRRNDDKDLLGKTRTSQSLRIETCFIVFPNCANDGEQ